MTVAITTVDHGDGRRPELWSLTVAVASGVGAGLLAAGTGGRLAMRLLAVTAGADTQGRITQAEQVVGRISVDSTLGSSTSEFTLLNVRERHLAISDELPIALALFTTRLLQSMVEVVAEGGHGVVGAEGGLANLRARFRWVGAPVRSPRSAGAVSRLLCRVAMLGQRYT